jgi:hypothetical protein
VVTVEVVVGVVVFPSSAPTSRRREVHKESLVAAALTNAEKKQLNALLRRLMIEFERAEGGPPPEEC